MKMRKGRTSSLRRTTFHLLTEYLSLRDFLRLSLPLVFTPAMAFIAHSLCGGGMENKHKVMNLRNRLVQQVSGCIRRRRREREAEDGVSHYKILEISAIKGNQFVNAEAIYEHGAGIEFSEKSFLHTK